MRPNYVFVGLKAKPRLEEQMARTHRRRHKDSEWPSRNPDPRWGALLMTARKILGATVKEAASLVGRSFETLVNAEHGVVKLGKRTEPLLLHAYLVEFTRRGGTVQLPAESATLAELRAALAKAIVVHQARGLVQSARGTDGDAEDIVDGVLSAAIQEQRITRRLRERLVGVSH